MTHRKSTLTASQMRIFERLLSFGPPSLDFPDPRKAYPEGVVAIGGRIDVPTLLAAYRLGIFPWPQDGLPLLWFCPEQRGILEFDQIHVGKSLRKFMRQHTELEVTINKGFRAVIENCQRQPRPNQNGSWIIPEMPESVDVLALPFSISIPVKNPSQTNLLSEVTIEADDAVTGQHLTLKGDPITLSP
jgi:leucyl/phenylalanyl-tRNA--protein transferase